VVTFCVKFLTLFHPIMPPASGQDMVKTQPRSGKPVLPWPSTISLSIPRGPSVEATASTTTSQALMLLMIWGFPWEVSVPSFSRMIGAGCEGKRSHDSQFLLLLPSCSQTVWCQVRLCPTTAPYCVLQLDYSILSHDTLHHHSRSNKCW